jgi:hypothetical protein
MRLESARELKQSLAERVLSRAALSPRAVSAFGLPARRLTEVDPVLPTLAVGIAPGQRNRYRLAVRIQRRGMESSPHVETIRKEARREVDVRYVGRVMKRSGEWYRERHRPLHIGTSIGHFDVTAGTLGCFVQTKSGQARILSNNHVLADENRGQRGDDILQPGRYDGGRRRIDSAGVLDRFARLSKRRTNRVDCALASLADGIEFAAANLHRAGALAGTFEGSVADLDLVEKLGRTTGHTHGRVTAFEVDNVVVEYDMGNLRFDDQIEIEGTRTGPFSAGGDSGSLIFTSGDRLAAALLFAGSQEGGSNGAGVTYANRLAAVLERLNVQVLT